MFMITKICCKCDGASERPTADMRRQISLQVYLIPASPMASQTRLPLY
eukprot:SAG11_NODE_37750_length_255_cov_0.987179_1_plen_47_part_10